jgi:hypothetical protein
MKITKLVLTFEKIVWNKVNRRSKPEPFLATYRRAMEPAGRMPTG